MRSQPPPAASTGPASKPKVGCSGSVPSCFSDARACAWRSSSPHDPGKSKIAFRSPSSAPAISKNDPGPFGFASGGGGGGAFFGASAARNPMPSLFFIAANRHSATGHAQVVDREAAADQRAQLHLRVQVRDVEHDRPLGIDDLQAVDGDRRRLVGDDVDQRAQPPGDAADVHLARLFSGSVLSISRPSRDPCSTTEAASTASTTVPTRPMTVNRITRTRRDRAKGPSLWHEVTGLGMLATRAIRAAGRRFDVRRRDRAAHAMLTMEGTPEAKPSLYILDALNFLFRAFHALPPLKTTKGTQTGAIYGLCQMILRIEREQKPTHLCVVYDAPGENFRNAALRPSTRPTGRRCRPSWPSSWRWCGGWSRRSA